MPQDTPTQNSTNVAGAAANKSVAPVAGAMAGVGIGAAVMGLIQGNPAVVNTMMTWGPTLVILVGIGVLADRHLPPLVKAVSNGADALHRASTVMEQSRDHEVSTTMALTTLSGKVEDLAELIRSKP